METGIENEAFLVLGMHRSGTSVLTRTLNILGAQLPHNLMRPAKDNPLGFWESGTVMTLNDRLLFLLNRSWDDPKPLPTEWKRSPDVIPAIDDAQRLLCSEFDVAGGLVLKDPRISRLLPVWRHAFLSNGLSPVCLIACRNPLEVYRSLNARNGIDAEHAFSLWVSYVLEAEIETRGMRRALVHYDQFLNNWRDELSHAFTSVGIAIHQWPDDARARADAAIDQTSRHHEATCDEFLDHCDANSLIKDTYTTIRFDDALEHTERFDELRQRWRANWEAADPNPMTSGLHHVMPNSRALRDARHLREVSSLLKFSGEPDEADGALREQLLLNPGDPAIHQALSRVMEQLGRVGEAIDFARAAAELGADLSHPTHHLGTLLARHGQPAEAELALRKSIKLVDDVAAVHNLLSQVLNQLGRTEDAIAAARKTVELDPALPLAQHHLGVLLEQSGVYGEAETVIRTSIALNGRVPDFYQSLSRVLWHAGRMDEAIAAARKAIELDPDLPHAQHLLGALLEQSAAFDEAETAFRKSIALNGEVPGFHQSLSRVLWHAGRMNEAIAAARKAVDLAPNLPLAYYLLGVQLEQYGALDEAEGALKMAVELDGEVSRYKLAMNRVRKRLVDDLDRIDTERPPVGEA